jgi:hypothetical protein
LQSLPAILQKTPSLLESLVTLAVKFKACPASMLCCVPGDIATDGCRDTGLREIGALEPPPQFVKRSIMTPMRPEALFTVTCPLPVSKSLFAHLNLWRQDILANYVLSIETKSS